MWHFVFRDVLTALQKQPKMSNVHDAMLTCLFSAQKQLDEAGGSGIFIMLIGADNTIRSGSAATNSDELLESMFLCVWETLRKTNPDVTPDGFAQAAYAIAMRTEAEPPHMVPFAASPGHALSE